MKLTITMSQVEACIIWAQQHGYCFAKDAMAEYSKWTGREHRLVDGYYNLWEFHNPEPKA